MQDPAEEAPLGPGVGVGSQRVADQHDREPGQGDHDRGADGLDRLGVQGAEAVVQEPAEVVVRGLHAEPDEGQRGDLHQGQREHRGGEDQQRLGHVRQHVPYRDADRADAEEARCDHVVAAGHRGGQVGRDPGEAGNAGDADRDDRGGHTRFQHGGDHQGEDQARVRHGGFQDAQGGLADTPAREPDGQADHDTGDRP